MAFKKTGTTNTTKRYIWPAVVLGNGIEEWIYVTTDAPTTVEVSGYFDDDELRAMLKAGDRLWVYQVAALDDDRTVQADINAGLSDVSFHVVVASDGAGVNITPDLLSATITYTS